MTRFRGELERQTRHRNAHSLSASPVKKTAVKKATGIPRKSSLPAPPRDPDNHKKPTASSEIREDPYHIVPLPPVLQSPLKSKCPPRRGYGKGLLFRPTKAFENKMQPKRGASTDARWNCSTHSNQTHTSNNSTIRPTTQQFNLNLGNTSTDTPATLSPRDMLSVSPRNSLRKKRHGTTRVKRLNLHVDQPKIFNRTNDFARRGGIQTQHSPRTNSCPNRYPMPLTKVTIR